MGKNRFERLYHGQLVLYESDPVSDAMIDFRDALLKWKRIGSKPTELESDDRSRRFTKPLDCKTKKKDSDFMKRLALALSKACREDLDHLEGTKK